MNITTTQDIPDIRARNIGIGLPQRRSEAKRVGNSTALLLRSALDRGLLDQESTIPKRDHPIQCFEKAAKSIVQVLHAAVSHSVVITPAPGKVIPTLVLQDLQTRKRTALRELLPSFHLQPPPAALTSRQPDATLATGSMCLCDALFASWRDSVANTLASYIVDMVDAGLLGFVMERAGNRIAYTYVIRAAEISPSSVKQHPTTVLFKPQEPLGSRRIHTTTTEAEGQSRHATEEHVHHLADSQTVPLGTATCPLPQRLVEFRRIIPSWLFPFLTVTEGTIVQEEVHTRDEYQTQWQTTVSTVIKASPAICFGDLVLAGWSDTDFEIDAKTRLATKQIGLGGIVLGGLALGALILVCPKAVAFIGRKIL